jgi:D-cysteine desulfhydrase
VDQLEIAGRPVLVKRDDQTALPYGGNKVRKLEFLLAAAQSAESRRVVTAGAFGSHHALATTIYGTLAGLRVSCVLFPQPLTDHVRAVLEAIAAHGAELRFTRRLEGVPFGLQRARWAHRSERACIVPPGGSNPVGALGYVEAGLELAGQLEAGSCPVPSGIYVAAGSLGTVAGLAIGLELAGRALPVHAVRITSPLVANLRALRALVRGTLELLRPGGGELPGCDQVLASITLRHDQIGDGYGRETAAANAATAAFAAVGLRLDGTYTAKAAAALLTDQPAERPPLFWNTLSPHEPRWQGPPLDVATLPEPFRTVLSR